MFDKTARSPFRRPLFRWCLAILLVCGCNGFPKPAWRGQSDELQRLVNRDRVGTEEIQGPTERSLNSLSQQKRREELKSDPNSGMAADFDRYEQAVAIYEQGEYAKAEKLFKQLVKDRRAVYESFGDRWRRWWGLDEGYDPFKHYGDPIEEDALFMLAECQFARQRYAYAQDSYDDLLNRYPATRHLERSTRQLFRIARYWLDFPPEVDSSTHAEMKLAGAEQITGKAVKFQEEPSTLRQIPVIPNLTDRTRPTFDTYGRGLQALRSIWLHDATGPLADDALMLSANFHLRAGNYQEAAADYKLLRENYPDSPHFKDAFILGSHVTFASYQGAQYDGRALEEARKLKQMALRMFPDLTPEQRQRLEEELALLRTAEEARLWNKVEFYEVKGVPESVALHCNLLINRYPDSPYADKARLKLNELAAARNQPSWNPWAKPRQLSPVESGAPVGPATPAPQGEKLNLPTEISPRDGGTTPGFWQRMGGMLRRAEEPPQLESVPQSDAASEPGKASL